MILIHTRDVGDIQPTEYIDCKIAVKAGQALKIEGGLAVLAAGADAPAYISVGESEAGSEARKIPVCRVDNLTVYETELSVASADIEVGKKYTLSATADGITATEGGCAEVVSYDGNAAGDRVRVRF